MKKSEIKKGLSHILVLGIVFIIFGIILTSIFIYLDNSIRTLNNFDKVKSGPYDEFMGMGPSSSNETLKTLNAISIACTAGSIILILLGIVLIINYKKLKKQENPKIRKLSSGIIIAGIILGVILFISTYVILYLTIGSKLP
jgi:uncharacterized membrane protein HdeD (DUF308 family)